MTNVQVVEKLKRGETVTFPNEYWGAVYAVIEREKVPMNVSTRFEKGRCTMVPKRIGRKVFNQNG